MKKYCLLLLSLLCLTTCINDEYVYDPQADGYASLTIKVPAVIMPHTRGTLDDVQENSIQEVDILVFEVEDNADERFKYRIQPTAISPVQGDPTRRKVDIKLERTSKLVRLVVLTNVHDIIESAGISPGELKADALNKLTFTISDKWPTEAEDFADPSLRFRPFPMWGQIPNPVSISTLSTFKEEVTLLRAVAKIDVGIDIEGDPSIGFGNRFLLERVYVYNVPDRAHVAPDMSDPGLENNKVTTPHIPSGINHTQYYYDFIWNPTPENPKQKLFNEIYIPENSLASMSRSFLVITGYLDRDPALCYYRIDFASQNSSDLMHVLRNHRYLINIIGAQGRGYSTLQEAVDSDRGSNMEYKLEVVEDEILDIKYNNQHMLGVDASTLLADWETAEKLIKVYTSYNSGWEASTTTNWIQFMPDLPANPSGTKNPNNNIITNLRFKLSENTTLRREGIITLKSGEITMDLKIIQEAGSNSLMIKTNRNARIPWAAANADGITRIPNASAFTLKLLWQDGLSVINSLSGQTVNTGSTEGNALIAAVDAANKVLWSWHIWVTNYDPSLSSSVRKNREFVFMDRNLGATSVQPDNIASLGFMYQWGRKDPFPGPSRFGTSVNGTRSTLKLYDIDNFDLPDPQTINYLQASTLEATIQNPTTFYMGAVSWMQDETLYNFWENEDGTKGPFDPCPFGWKVPSSGPMEWSPWYGLPNPDVYAAGIEWKDYGYYPYSGYRQGADGTFKSVRQEVHVTTATSIANGHFVFAYRSGSVDPSYNGGVRSNAYPVRCVKVSTW